MKDVKASRIVGGNPSGERSKGDFYPTPKEATQALLDFLEIPKSATIWEPAYGEGDMANVFFQNGYSVRVSDISWGHDFLLVPMPEGTDWIITNPPFSLAEQFIERSMEHGVPFAMLLKSQFWHAKRRQPLFWKRPPTYILPLTWRPDFNFKKKDTKGSPLMDVMWVVWDKGDRGEATRYVPLDKPIGIGGEDGRIH